jgi:hypothetical protein
VVAARVERSYPFSGGNYSESPEREKIVLWLLDTVQLKSDNLHNRLSQMGFVFYLNIFHRRRSIIGAKHFFLYFRDTSRVRGIYKTAGPHDIM